MAIRKVLRSWRVTEASPSGCHVWFDPLRETIALFELEPSPEERVDDVSEGDGSDDSRPEQISLMELVEDELPF